MINRLADENNPKGYFEYADVMRLHSDDKWVSKGVNKCVKVIAQLIQNLPDKFDYRIVFMQRDMSEILSSQNTMLGCLNSSQTSDSEQLQKAYNAQLNQLDRWLGSQKNIELLYIDYDKTIHNSENTANALNNFFNTELNTAAMCSAVEPTLYRERTA